MRVRETFVYYMFNEDRKALYITPAGTVAVADDDMKRPDGTYARLEHAFEGWENTSFKYARNTKYWGLTRDFTTPLVSVLDGARMLIHLYKAAGYEAIAYLGIGKLHPTDLPYRYQVWHTVELNFAKYERSLAKVKIEGLEGGASKFLKANEATVYEIDIADDVMKKRFLADGIRLPFSRTYLMETEQKAVDVDNYVLGMFQSAREGEPNDMIFQDNVFGSASVYPNNSWTIDTQRSQDVVISGSVKIEYFQNITFMMRAEDNDGATPGGTILYNLVNRAGTTGEIVTVDFNQTLTLAANHRLHFKHFMFNPTNTGDHYRILEGELKIDYGYRNVESYIEGLWLMRVFEKLVDKVTGGLYQAKSTWLTGRKDIILTSGDALRKIEGSKMKISLVDFFQSLPFAGLGVEGDKIVIEQLDYFFKSGTVLQLGEVKDATHNVAEDLPGNVIKAGYEEEEYDDANGRNEQNQGQTWEAPVKKILRELLYVSKVRADAMGAELVRINYENRTTTDAQGDNDTWMIHVADTILNDPDVGDYQEYYRVVYDDVQNLPYWETWFNLELTPKKRLLQNGRLLRSLFAKLDGKKITLASADRNKEVITTLGVTVFTEKEDIEIGPVLGDQIFTPDYFNFTTKVPTGLLTIMDAAPYDKVEFIWKGRKWYGYIWDGAIQPGNNDAQKWKLLAAPGQDLSKF